MNFRVRSALVTTCVALCALLTGCNTSSPNIESRLTPGQILDDELLTEAIRVAIRDEFRSKDLPHQVNTLVLDGRVFLIGSVQEQSHKDLVSDIASDFRHVRSVQNELHVGELRKVGEANGDRTIATSARLALLNDPRTRAQEFNLYTHKGSVYLIGITPRSVGAAAADVVKYVRGVKTVVLLIDYLD
ncbi:MAG: BON domain-containing protein [Gammaproteobacteria bacterium]|nr:BON domain-containing protein [Gammaproteobacteria bacterium]